MNEQVGYEKMNTIKCYKCGKDFNEHIEERIVGNKSVLVSFLCPTKVCETFTLS